jgi:glycosyltransferase involved in cell wall biosynthesis
MSGLPLVSIVTPSYNQAQFLEQAILSVLHQDYPNIEYIIIDGGSTDGSVAIIRKYKKWLAYWVSEPDSGQAEAINKGWSRCTGQIIAYLNSDDYYLPAAMTKVVRAFELHPDVGVVVGQAQWVSKEGTCLQTTDFRISGDETWNLFDLYNQTSVPQPAAFVAKRVLDRIGFLDPSLHYGLDGDFFMRASGNFKTMALDHVLACMRVHERSKSVATGLRFAPDIMRIAQKVITKPHEYPRFDVIPNRVLAGVHILSARLHYFHGAYRVALTNLLTSARLSIHFWPLIIFREMPHMVVRILLGKRAYVWVSSYFRRELGTPRRATSM